jgi:chromosome segregation ATPase
VADLKRALLGYSSASVRAALADRELMLERASTDARSAEERADRLASELWETQRRLGETEEQLRSVQEVGEALAADLERSVAEREAMEAQVTSLHEALGEVKAAIAATEADIAAKDEEVAAAAERTVSLHAELVVRTRERDDLAADAAGARQTSAELQEHLNERNRLLATAREESSKAQVWLRRALEESADYKKSLSAEQARVAELEELLATYRAELEERAAAATESPRVERSPEPDEGPSTASELAAVLQVTEEAVVRIMESTLARADRELANVDQDRERVGRELEEMRAWRDRAAPMIASLQSTMDEVLGQVSEIGARVGEVLRPVTGAVTRLTSQLASLDTLSHPAPRPVEPASGSSEGGRVIELREDQTAGREAWHDQ